MLAIPLHDQVELGFFQLAITERSVVAHFRKLLFEQVEHQKAYDERRLLRKLKTDKRTFAVAKNYLQEQILKSLRNFHEGMSVKSRIHALLLNVEILCCRSFLNSFLPNSDLLISL